MCSLNIVEFKFKNKELNFCSLSYSYFTLFITLKKLLFGKSNNKYKNNK